MLIQRLTDRLGLTASVKGLTCAPLWIAYFYDCSDYDKLREKIQLKTVDLILANYLRYLQYKTFENHLSPPPQAHFQTHFSLENLLFQHTNSQQC